MKDNKKLEVLLKVIQKIYDKNPEMQGVISALMIEVCSQGGVSHEQVFLLICAFLCCAFIIMAILQKKSKQGLNETTNNVNNSQETILIIHRYEDIIKAQNEKAIWYTGKQEELVKYF